MPEDTTADRQARVVSIPGTDALGSTARPDGGVSSPSARIHVHDQGVLVDPWAYGQRARAAAFQDVVMGPITFHGIAPCPFPEIPEWMAAHYPGVTLTTTCLRRSPRGQDEPSFIHQDRDMGQTSGILYLTPDPPPGDGTVFYRRKATGAVQSVASEPDEFQDEWITWRDGEAWEPWTRVEARFGRLVLFPSSYFHARAIRENYGAVDDGSARLVQLLFGMGTLEDAVDPRVAHPGTLTTRDARSSSSSCAFSTGQEI